MSRERPILFSGEMVRAILENRKTQTRRIVKPQPGEGIDRLHGGKLRQRFPYQLEDDNCNPCGKGFQDDQNRFWICPYGQPGDRLWVRETWKCHCDCNADGEIDDSHPLGTCVKYRADGAMIKPTLWGEDEGFWCEAREMETKWRSSIFMPRWASRITLEITAVRVERLQEISDSDALAEGVTIRPDAGIASLISEPHTTPAQLEYYALWQSIHGPGSWEAKPWVWVVEFRRVKE